MVHEKPRLMVTGASGLLGHAICQASQESWAVYGVYRNNKPRVAGLHTIQADLRNPGCHRDLIQSVQPRAVIHAAANADVIACEKNPHACDDINRQVPVRMAKYCNQAGVAYLFTSTDLVFDGRQAPYDESASACPICVYGEQKAMAEAEVLNGCPDALVCRLPLLFGAGPYSGHHFSVQMLQTMRGTGTLKLFVDEFRTPVDIESAAHGVLTLLGREKGIFHLGGHTRISRYGLGLAMARQLDIEPSMIRPVRLDQVKMAAARAADCSLVSQKAYAAGYRPASLEKGLQRFFRQFERFS